MIFPLAIKKSVLSHLVWVILNALKPYFPDKKLNYCHIPGGGPDWLGEIVFQSWSTTNKFKSSFLIRTIRMTFSKCHTFVIIKNEQYVKLKMENGKILPIALCILKSIRWWVAVKLFTLHSWLIKSVRLNQKCKWWLEQEI